MSKTNWTPDGPAKAVPDTKLPSEVPYNKVDPMFERLDQTELKYEELNKALSSPDIVSDSARFQKTAKAHSELQPIVEKYREYKDLTRGIQESKAMLADESDPEMRAYAQDELTQLEERVLQVEAELKVLLLPKDPNDEKNVILEIRAGTGGDEATLFAAEIFRMYTRYAESQRWKVEVLSTSESSVGGLKEVIAIIEGQGVYSRMKYESGVHRVQRVPQTETQGRVHTSAVTVAVLPEAEDVDIKIEAKDIRIDTFCSSGPGRPVGEHDVLGGAHHAPADQHGGELPGREVADQESRERNARAARPPVRDGAAEAAGRAGQGAQGDGGQRRSQREDPHLQLPAEPRHRSPHRLHRAPVAGVHGRPHPAHDRRADHALPGREDEAGDGGHGLIPCN